MAKKTFKVAGVTFSNGIFSGSRQKVVKKCSYGDRIILERDYGNKHGDHAVKVLTEEGEQLGYIPSGNAKSKRVFLSLEAGNNVTAKVSDTYNFLDESNVRIYGLEIEVDNLLSASRAKEVENKGCLGIILLIITVISVLGIAL